MIRPLSDSDIPAALGLCRCASWNQVEDDWLRLIDYEPEGCFAAEIDGNLVGTVTTTCYGTDLAWIGMMLVDPQHRRQGIATAMMTHALDYLDRRGVACVKLDATPMGAKVYEQLGFRIELDFQRWVRDNNQEEIGDAKTSSDALSPQHYFLDRDAFNADRSTWLERLSAEAFVIADTEGYGMLRPGYLGDYIGPLVATDPFVARDLLSRLLHRSTARQCFWDVIDSDAIEIAESLGFRPIRDLHRMARGDSPTNNQTCRQYAPCDLATG